MACPFDQQYTSGFANASMKGVGVGDCPTFIKMFNNGHGQIFCNPGDGANCFCPAGYKADVNDVLFALYDPSKGCKNGEVIDACHGTNPTRNTSLFPMEDGSADTWKCCLGEFPPAANGICGRGFCLDGGGCGPLIQKYAAYYGNDPQVSNFLDKTHNHDTRELAVQGALKHDFGDLSNPKSAKLLDPVTQTSVANYCNKVPGACDQTLLAACSTINSSDELKDKPALAKMCGCFMKPSVYLNYYPQAVSKECSPPCNALGAIREGDGAAVPNQVKCGQDVCVMDGVTIDILNSQTGDINLASVCRSENPNGKFSCWISDATFNIASSVVDGDINLCQDCSDTQIYSAANPSLTRASDCHVTDKTPVTPPPPPPPKNSYRCRDDKKGCQECGDASCPFSNADDCLSSGQCAPAPPPVNAGCSFDAQYTVGQIDSAMFQTPPGCDAVRAGLRDGTIHCADGTYNCMCPDFNNNPSHPPWVTDLNSLMTSAPKEYDCLSMGRNSRCCTLRNACKGNNPIMPDPTGVLPNETVACCNGEEGAPINKCAIGYCPDGSSCGDAMAQRAHALGYAPEISKFLSISANPLSRRKVIDSLNDHYFHDKNAPIPASILSHDDITTIVNYCNTTAGACDDTLALACSNITDVDNFIGNPLLAQICGCHLKTSVYADTYPNGLTKQCMPPCMVTGAIREADPATQPTQFKQCTQGACVMDDITVNEINSQTGSINLKQVCNAEGHDKFTCWFSNNNVNIINSKVAGQPNVLQDCDTCIVYDKTNPLKSVPIPECGFPVCLTDADCAGSTFGGKCIGNKCKQCNVDTDCPSNEHCVTNVCILKPKTYKCKTDGSGNCDECPDDTCDFLSNDDCVNSGKCVKYSYKCKTDGSGDCDTCLDRSCDFVSKDACLKSGTCHVTKPPTYKCKKDASGINTGECDICDPDETCPFTDIATCQLDATCTKPPPPPTRYKCGKPHTGFCQVCQLTSVDEPGCDYSSREECQNSAICKKSPSPFPPSGSSTFWKKYGIDIIAVVVVIVLLLLLLWAVKWRK